MYKKISEYGFKVVIEGHGSDEQLGGYPYLIQSALNESIRSLDFFRAKELIKTFFQTLNPNLGERSSLQRKLKFIARTFINSFTNKNSFQDDLDYAFSYKILPIVLRTFDRMSMANSIESRMPFMDYRFVEFIRKLPSKEKVNKIGNKAILREILLKYKNYDIALNRKKINEIDVVYNRRSSNDGKKLKFSDAWGILWKMLEIRFNYIYASALFFLI